jgi:hypothetical protein
MDVVWLRALDFCRGLPIQGSTAAVALRHRKGVVNRRVIFSPSASRTPLGLRFPNHVISVELAESESLHGSPMILRVVVDCGCSACKARSDRVQVSPCLTPKQKSRLYRLACFGKAPSFVRIDSGCLYNTS